MSKESKALLREFWIEERAYETLVATKECHDGSIHVIEYSALLEERAKSARLLEALKFYADKNNWLRDEKGWRHDMIINDLDDETLTDWDGRFSGKKAREALERP